MYIYYIFTKISYMYISIYTQKCTRVFTIPPQKRNSKKQLFASLLTAGMFIEHFFLNPRQGTIHQTMKSRFIPPVCQKKPTTTGLGCLLGKKHILPNGGETW